MLSTPPVPLMMLRGARVTPVAGFRAAKAGKGLRKMLWYGKHLREFVGGLSRFIVCQPCFVLGEALPSWLPLCRSLQTTGSYSVYIQTFIAVVIEPSGKGKRDYISDNLYSGIQPHLDCHAIGINQSRR